MFNISVFPWSSLVLRIHKTVYISILNISNQTKYFSLTSVEQLRINYSYMRKLTSFREKIWSFTEKYVVEIIEDLNNRIVNHPNLLN